MTYKIKEIFTSIQGEGLLVGKPMNFIRSSGCNLRCRWCDTNHVGGEEKTIKQIIDELDERIIWVALTGGEPMMQANLIKLIKSLKPEGYSILLETNGTLYDKKIFDSCDYISADLKGPSSGNPGHEDNVIKYCLSHPNKTQLKIVLADKKDLCYYKTIYIRYPHWVLQPESSVLDKIDYIRWMDELTADMLADTRIIPQTHKIMKIK